MSRDDFTLLLILNSFTHSNKQLMKSIFLKSALNRSDDRSKRNNIAAYERYLDKSIEKAIQKLAETIIGSIGGEADIMNSWIKIDDSSLAEF